MTKEIYIAPVQGHTDAAWRHFHHETYGGDLRYFTPFIRCEHGELRRQDLRDFTSELNAGLRLESQVIFRDMEELEILLRNLSDAGAREVNLNMGCPFPLQTGKGRGAGFLTRREEAERLPEVLQHFPGLTYSVKMRLGFGAADEWRGIIDILNAIPLRHVDVHPRIARQQYSGEPDMEEFSAILSANVNPVVYNGDMTTPADMEQIAATYPEVAGLMVARGVLGRPSLAAEYASGKEWSREERIEKMLRFHRRLFDHYSDLLCGDAQILSKIKPFWEYAETETGRKAWKAIKKSSNMAKYHSAVAMIEK